MNATSPDANRQAIQEALALHREGKRDLAMQRYVAILEKDPSNGEVLYYVAAMAVQEGQFAEGIRVILRALDVGGPSARLYNLLGQANLRLNQDDEALRNFGQAIAADPEFVDAYGNRATLLAELGRPIEALKDFDRALMVRPDNAADLCNRAGVLAGLGRLDDALAGFNRAIELMPHLAPAYFNRGDLWMRGGRADLALADYDKAIELYPDMAHTHARRGRALEALGRTEEARESFARATELEPKIKKPN